MGNKRLVSFTGQCSTIYGTLIVKKYLARHSVITLEHPSYSPDLAPAEFYPFPRLKMKLKGHRFVDSDEVIENAMKQLKDVSKNGFQECFEQLYERWKKCVERKVL
ncbi:hypothetical protein AVEN_189708-1 [Araneus ventricosus]|uniref:Histone-lysine N-methyltransferase SETMAR n=1 Tax=Araneus ventricosus TaxID=182803 RepID=A0A4Y2J1G1_ARAVE|nr:hypothetical protein AVEN_189708-1 [Araneus ventricosus]